MNYVCITVNTEKLASHTTTCSKDLRMIKTSVQPAMHTKFWQLHFQNGKLRPYSDWNPPKFINNCYIKHSKTFNDFTGVSVYSTNCLSNSNQHWQCTLYANLLCSSKCTSTVHSNKRDRITTHISTHTSQSCSIALGICSQFNNRGWVVN